MNKFLTLLVFLGFFSIQSRAQDTTAAAPNNYFLEFVKKVYFNPTVLLRTQNFREQTNVRAVVLPDFNGSGANQITGFEKALQKIIRFLIEGDDKGSVRFYFDIKNGTKPFSFVCSEELWCKFKNSKDSIENRLNAPFAGASFNLNSHVLFETAIDSALDYIAVCLQNNLADCGEEPENQTTVINTKPIAISLHNTSGSKFDIDQKQFSQLESHYAKATDLFTQQDWYAPAKAVVSGMELDEPMVLAITKHESIFKKENLKLKMVYNNGVLPVLAGSTNDSIRFNIPKNLPKGNPVEVVVTYKSPVDSITYTVGFFMVQVMEKQTVKLNLLAANGFTISDKKAEIESALKKVYDPLGISFEVSVKNWNPLPDSEWPTAIEVGSSGLLSNYPPDLRDWVNGVQDLADYDKEEYYLVVGLSSSELAGYMPRARNIGFIFSGATDFGETVAHELGHGVFHLRHIFADEELGAEQIHQTRNVMDYKEVAANKLKDLYLHQWKFIADPAFVSLFSGDDEDGALTITQNIPDEFRNPGSRTITCHAKSGSLITLPANTTYLEFSTIDPLFFISSGEYADRDAPVGTLMGFKIQVGDVVSSYQYRGSGNSIYYIKDNDESKKYVDSLTKNEINNINSITAFPYYENGKFGFTLYKTEAAGKVLFSPSLYNGNKSDFQQAITIFNPFSQFSIIDYVTGVTPDTGDDMRAISYKDFFKNKASAKVDGQIGVAISILGKSYLEHYKQHCNSSNPFAPIIISNALWISRFESIESISKCKFDQFVNSESMDLFRAQFPIPTCSTNVQIPYTLDDAAFDKFLKFRKYITEIKNASDEDDGLITQIQTLFNSNQSYYDIYVNNSILIDKLKVIDDCALENLNIDLRIFLINILEPQNEEGLILKLIRTTKFNAQISALVNRLFQGDGNVTPLFERLWDRFHGEEFHKLINKLSEYTLIAKYGEEVTKTIKLGNRSSLFLNGQEKSGTFEITAINYDWVDGNKFMFHRKYYESNDIVQATGSYYNRNHDQWVSFDYNEVINIEFSSAAQDILKFDDNYTDKTIALPAFHLAYLVYERNKSDNLRVVRVIGNLIAIAAAIPTGGASLTLVGGISIAVAAGDIIVAVNEDELNKTESGKTFLSVWSAVQWVDVGLGAMNIGKATYKYTVNTARRFKFVYGELSTKIATDANYGNSLVSTLRQAIAELEVLGLSCWTSVLNTRLIARLEATIIKAKFGVISENAELIIKSEIEGFIKINGVEKKIFNIKPSSKGAFIEPSGELMTSKLATGDKVIGKLDKARFKKGNDIVSEDLYLIKTSNGVRLAVNGAVKITTTSELKAFLKTIDETTTIVQIEQRGIKSLFRGTTRSKADNTLFSGNTNTQEFGISTSTDPIKATIFSIESATSNGAYNGVLQIGLPSDLRSIGLNSPNIYRCEKELELVLQTPANNFANLSTVEISAENARKLVKEVYGIDLPAKIYPTGLNNSNELLETIPASSLDKAFEFYQKALQYNLK